MGGEGRGRGQGIERERRVVAATTVQEARAAGSAMIPRILRIFFIGSPNFSKKKLRLKGNLFIYSIMIYENQLGNGIGKERYAVNSCR